MYTGCGRECRCDGAAGVISPKGIRFKRVKSDTVKLAETLGGDSP
jgi:hypothetical protein